MTKETPAAEATETNEFSALLADLGTLQKSMSAGGEGDEAPAATGDDAAAGGGDGGDVGEPGDDEGDEPISKSLRVTLADGTEADAFDGTELVKSLQADNEALRGSLTTLRADALAGQTALVETVKAQGEMLKSLAGEIKALRSSGVGRRSMVSVTPPAAPAAPAAASPNELMSKAAGLSETGKMSALDISRVHSFLSKGLALPPDLAKALS